MRAFAVGIALMALSLIAVSMVIQTVVLVLGTK